MRDVQFAACEEASSGEIRMVKYGPGYEVKKGRTCMNGKLTQMPPMLQIAFAGLNLSKKDRRDKRVI